MRVHELNFTPFFTLPQAVLATAVRLGGAGVGVSVVSSCDHAARVLQERAARAGIKILHTLQAEDATSLGRDVARFVTGQVVSAPREASAATALAASEPDSGNGLTAVFIIVVVNCSRSGSKGRTKGCRF